MSTKWADHRISAREAMAHGYGLTRKWLTLRPMMPGRPKKDRNWSPSGIDVPLGVQFVVATAVPWQHRKTCTSTHTSKSTCHLRKGRISIAEYAMPSPNLSA